MPGSFMAYTVICAGVRTYYVIAEFRTGDGVRQECALQMNVRHKRVCISIHLVPWTAQYIMPICDPK
ncbi:MAG: hypothetical protein NVSMB27_00760 [Ktedonobacteraceae bacterium]